MQITEEEVRKIVKKLYRVRAKAMLRFFGNRKPTTMQLAVMRILLLAPTLKPDTNEKLIDEQG